jgi:hypothetical protein
MWFSSEANTKAFTAEQTVHISLDVEQILFRFCGKIYWDYISGLFNWNQYSAKTSRFLGLSILFVDIWYDSLDRELAHDKVSVYTRQHLLYEGRPCA